MYCSGCGQPLAPYQQACAHCGKPAMPAAPVGFLPYSRVQQHVHTLGVLWVAYSAFALLAWYFAIHFVGFMFGHGMFHRDFPFGMPLPWLMAMGTTFIYIRSGLGLLVGIGLLRRERWARPLALVVGILVLFKIPFGTALGIYTLWVLVPTRSAMEYDAVTAR